MKLICTCGQQLTVAGAPGATIACPACGNKWRVPAEAPGASVAPGPARTSRGKPLLVAGGIALAALASAVVLLLWLAGFFGTAAPTDGPILVAKAAAGKSKNSSKTRLEAKPSTEGGEGKSPLALAVDEPETVEWAAADQDSARTDFLQATVRGVFEERSVEGNRLIVHVRVVSGDRFFLNTPEVPNWWSAARSQVKDANNPRLTDSASKEYAVAAYDKKAVADADEPELVPLAGAVQFAVGFALPEPKYDYLRLELPNEGQTIRFEIPKSMVGTIDHADAFARLTSRSSTADRKLAELTRWIERKAGAAPLVPVLRELTDDPELQPQLLENFKALGAAGARALLDCAADRQRFDEELRIKAFAYLAELKGNAAGIRPRLQTLSRDRDRVTADGAARVLKALDAASRP